MKRRVFCKTVCNAVAVTALARSQRTLAADAAADARAAVGTSRRDVLLAPSDLDDLRRGLRGQLLLAGDPGYDGARPVWNGAFDRKPALIARCQNAADVAHSVAFARAHELLLAVRGGGHSFAGHSSCDGGFMIDLSPMRGVRVDRGARTARIESGVLLGELDHATQKAGFVTTTGTVSHTGAAGLTLGGGFGRLARRFGLACDNLLSAEVVTADGTRVTANARENPDLFWALRGGGGNFGIATAFEYRLHPSPPVTIGGALVCAFREPRALLRAYADFAASASDDFFAMVDIVPTPEGQRLAVIEVCHSGAPAAAERELAALRKIGHVLKDSLRPMPYLTMQARIDADYPAGRGYYLKSGFVREIRPRLIDAVVDLLEAGAAPRCIASFLQVGGAIARVPPEATAYWHRDAGHQLVLAGVWNAPADADAPRRWVRAGWETLEPLTDGFYVNLLAPDESARRIRATYGGNLRRLVALKKRYDPTNLFRLNANIPPDADRGAA